ALPPMLHVEGNKLKTADGKEVWLQGLAIASLEWGAGGDNILKSIGIAIDDWKANCIRLDLREHFYKGIGPYQKDGGAGYRQLVEDAVNLCASKGVYIALDLHRFRAPEKQDVEFWQTVSEKYKNHPAVIFELFNEPHDVPWNVWRDGGVVYDKKTAENVAAENKEALKKFETVGMQKLVDVVRESGAKNIVAVGGLDWSYDLSGILKGFALDDKGGNGIMYVTHVYPWKSDWQNKFLVVAEKYPLFITEVGCMEKPMPWQKTTENPHTWAPDMIGLIQKYKLNWTGWCFHPKSSPCILSDWEYTPTPYWGAYVKKALAGEQFEMKKMR
ncbi:MAG: cellulase family glycosylhydrolase, partial [Planctomycetes bacterium]|nr:cellulase family glycosylhydrolase [Planctomycetota bacterium]